MHIDFYIFACCETPCTIDNPVCRDINMVGKVGKHSYSRESRNCQVEKLVRQKLQKPMNISKLFMLD